ncbi:MAG: hypothetical protein U0457_20095 [Candidatus Sericytochromatia bacterium]
MSSISSFSNQFSNIQALKSTSNAQEVNKVKENTKQEDSKPVDPKKAFEKTPEHIATVTAQAGQALVRSVSTTVAQGGLKDTKVDSLDSLKEGVTALKEGAPALTNKQERAAISKDVTSLLTKYGVPPSKQTFMQKLTSMKKDLWNSIKEKCSNAVTAAGNLISKAKGLFTKKKEQITPDIKFNETNETDKTKAKPKAEIEDRTDGSLKKLGTAGKVYDISKSTASAGISGMKVIAAIKNSESLKLVAKKATGILGVITSAVDTVKSVFSFRKTRDIRNKSAEFLKDPSAAQIKKAETKIQDLTTKLATAKDDEKPAIQGKIDKLQAKLKDLKSPEGKGKLVESESTLVLNQINKRQDVKHKGFQIAKNVIGTTAAAIGVAVTFGALATPVGWVAMGVSAAGAIGLGIYKYFKKGARENIKNNLQNQEKDLGNIKNKIEESKTQLQAKMTDIDAKIKEEPNNPEHVDAKQKIQAQISDMDKDLGHINELADKVQVQLLLKSPEKAQQFLLEKLSNKQDTPEAKEERKQAKLIAVDVLGIKPELIKSMVSGPNAEDAKNKVSALLKSKVQIFT